MAKLSRKFSLVLSSVAAMFLASMLSTMLAFLLLPSDWSGLEALSLCVLIGLCTATLYAPLVLLIAWWTRSPSLIKYNLPALFLVAFPLIAGLKAHQAAQLGQGDTWSREGATYESVFMFAIGVPMGLVAYVVLIVVGALLDRLITIAWGDPDRSITTKSSQQ
jgi:hypothetical protein